MYHIRTYKVTQILIEIDDEIVDHRHLVNV